MNGASLRARLAWSPAVAEPDAPAATEGVEEREFGRPTDSPHFDTALRLTAIALLLRPMGPWFVRPAILAAAVLVLIFPKALRQWQVWGALAVLTAIRIVNDWPLADNHIYLLGYWLFAVSLALRSPDAASTLADASRALIGLAFAFAVVWKVALSPDFLDGRFFRVTLVTDPRFAAVAQLIGGLSADQLKAAREAVALLPHGAELLDPPAMVEPARLRLFAMATTWGTPGDRDAGRGAHAVARAPVRLAAAPRAAVVLCRDVCVRAGRRVRMAVAGHGPRASGGPAGLAGPALSADVSRRPFLRRSALGGTGVDVHPAGLVDCPGDS